MSRRGLQAVSAVLIACAMALLVGVPASAQQSTSKITLGIEQPYTADLPDVLTAHLTGPDGGPISSEPVEFWVAVTLLGDRYAYLGSAITDSSGVARLPFVPHKDDYDVRATFDGDGTWGAAEGMAPIEFDPAHVLPYAPTDDTQLGTLRFVMPRIMGIIVGLIWAALIALAFVTLRSFKRQGA
jgi:hypothetical protein